MKPIELKKFLATEEDLSKHCKELYQLLTQKEEAFVLWLDGDMGAGKTTFVRHLLKNNGLDPSIPVSSPTYTLMNEYEIGKEWFAHIDFYRANAAFSLEEMGVLDARTFRGIFIEWPETPPTGQSIMPTHVLKIRPHGDNARTYSFYGLSN